MKRFFLLIVVVIMLVPTCTWAKGGSYTRKAPIPVAASIATLASFSGRDIQRQTADDCGSMCQSRSFRHAKGSY
jgi:hypothetical protein